MFAKTLLCAGQKFEERICKMFLNILMSEHQSVVTLSFIELSTDENKGYRIRKNVSKDSLI